MFGRIQNDDYVCNVCVKYINMREKNFSSSSLLQELDDAYI